MIIHGSRSVFLDSRFSEVQAGFYGSRSVFMGFQGSRLVFHGSRWVFMVPGLFS